MPKAMPVARNADRNPNLGKTPAMKPMPRSKTVNMHDCCMNNSKRSTNMKRMSY